MSGASVSRLVSAEAARLGIGGTVNSVAVKANMVKVGRVKQSAFEWSQGAKPGAIASMIVSKTSTIIKNLNGNPFLNGIWRYNEELDKFKCSMAFLNNPEKIGQTVGELAHVLVNDNTHRAEIGVHILAFLGYVTEGLKNDFGAANNKERNALAVINSVPNEVFKQYYTSILSLSGKFTSYLGGFNRIVQFRYREDGVSFRHLFMSPSDMARIISKVSDRKGEILLKQFRDDIKFHSGATGNFQFYRELIETLNKELA
jgi:hypothetical protein